MDERRDPSESSVNVADPHQPPYVYNQMTSYDSPRSRESKVKTAEGHPDQDTFDEDEDFDSDDEEYFFDNDIAFANAGDYTKSYNRQRHLYDPNVPPTEVPRANPQQKPRANVAALVDDQISSLARHAGKIKLDEQTAGLKYTGSGLGQERSDRATNEQVLDPKTRMILLQLINRGIISEIHGCISTGKEANVYHGFVDTSAGDGAVRHLAVKIYKTAILHFKDRSKYVSGEFRFQKGFAKRSNRGMVRLWAEKEFRNLKRMHSAGLPVPEPIYLKSHVLVMDLVGTAARSGRILAAPLLRDIEFEAQAHEQQAIQWTQIYRRLVTYMRVMYQTCKLVHADLSEYNLLYESEKERLTIIDVSQSVEHDHPRSLDFLRMDIKNVSSFFMRKGVHTLTEPSAFHFITNESAVANRELVDSSLDSLVKNPIDPEANDEVFRQQYIPQTLNQVPNFESIIGLDPRENAASHHSLLALNGQFSAGSAASDADSSQDSSENGEAVSSEEGEGYDAKPAPRPRGKRFEDKTVKKEHKALVKEERRERRKTKMPKQTKKRLVSTKTRSRKK